jgi:hypothetical protein
MSKYHLMHCIPHPQMHGLNGYKEVIDSVSWGLDQLGHEVSYSLNSFNPSVTNIIFGAQVLPIETLEKLPKDSIVYNLEQWRGLTKNDIRPEVQFYAENFQIWEYSLANFDTWKLLGVNDPKLVPVAYAPILTRIPKYNIQDIDILIYGMSGDKRLTAFHRLSLAGLKVIFVSGLYGEARDTLIARSKIVLNINLYNMAQIFEIVRVSYLLANKKAIVAILDPNTEVENDVINSVKFSTLEKIVDDCFDLLENDGERARLETIGYENFIKRDIKTILHGTLA